MLENWKIKELEIEKSFKNLKKYQQKMTENETKLNMVNNHINSFYLNKNNNSLIN